MSDIVSKWKNWKVKEEVNKEMKDLLNKTIESVQQQEIECSVRKSSSLLWDYSTDEWKDELLIDLSRAGEWGFI